ncbi:MAG: hypothetical protein Q7R40_13165 [Phaeospirillum sp.]|nr:hypothetical protein [Phaeospirillum sp.]
MLSALLGMAYLVHSRARITECVGAHYSDDDYMAWCGSAEFQDYEHGAYFWDLEPPVMDNVRKADVLFLGNSLGQSAFSTEHIRRYFAERGLTHHLLGFGFGEANSFPEAIFRKFGLTPRIVVANAASFFLDNPTGLASSVMFPSSATMLEYKIKRWLQPVHRRACEQGGATLRKLVCGEAPTIYRSRRDGHWRHRNFPDGKRPLIFTGPPESLPPSHPHVLAALRLRDAVAAWGGCLVLSSTPSSDGRYVANARAIAAASGIPLIVPDQLSDLTAYDGEHLDPPSAERFSAGFTAGLDQALTHCRTP